MAKRKHTSEEIAAWLWTHTSDDDGDFTIAQLQGAASIVAAKQLVRAANALDSILSQIRSLGADGIHTAIRHVAKKARRVEKRERAKRKAAKAPR